MDQNLYLLSLIYAQTFGSCMKFKLQNNFFFLLFVLLIHFLTKPVEVVREAMDIEIAKDENFRFQNFLIRFRKIKDKNLIVRYIIY